MSGAPNQNRSALVRCSCGALLKRPYDVPAIRCPLCAQVLRLEGLEPARPRLRASLRDGASEAPPGPPDPPAHDAVDLAWPPEDDAQELPGPHDPTPLPGPPTPGVVASLLRPMPRRRTDPILLWGSIAAAGILLGVLGYLLGHTHGLKDAMAELGAPVLEVAPPSKDETDRTTTGRELFRLCRVLDETRPDFDDALDEKTAAGRARLDAWIAPWRNGWDGPLGKAVRDLDLKLDWVCYVTGYDAGRGFSCLTRPTGGTAFRVNAFGLGARFWTGQEQLHTGDRIALTGVRHALEAGVGATLQLDSRCEVTVIVDQPSLARVVR